MSVVVKHGRGRVREDVSPLGDWGVRMLVLDAPGFDHHRFGGRYLLFSRLDTPVYIRKRGGGRRGGCGLRRVISSVIHTSIRQSHGLGQNLSVGVVITDTPVYIRE